MDSELDLLRRRYVQKLDELYGGEMEHLNVLPEMAATAHSSALKSAFQYHFEKTMGHVERLNHILTWLGIRPVNFQHRETKVLAREVQRFLATQDEMAECDAVLITAARKMEHYEISSYILALRYAQVLQEDTAADLLEQTLQEEYEADQILAEIDAPYSSSAGTRVEHGDVLNLALAGYRVTDDPIEA